MIIHFFSKGDKSIPSSRYRVYFLAEELNNLGFLSKVYPLDLSWRDRNSILENIGSFFQYLKIFCSFDKKDIIILQRPIHNKYFYLAVLFARIFFGRKFVFDFDDAIFKHSFFKTVILVKLANLITCGSHFVLEWAKKYNPNSFYLPDAIPIDKYFCFTKNYQLKNNPPLIGWVGDGPIHFENLAFFKKILEKLDGEGIQFKFKLVGAKEDQRIYSLFSSFSKEKIEMLDWVDYQDVPKTIQQFDIGVTPLLDNPWNRAKYVKTLEYMACAVPPIASNIGENRFIIRNGEKGFLAGTSEEWVSGLKNLILNPKLREKLGKSAQLDIKEKFSIIKITESFISLLKEKW